ncbi:MULTISPECIES: D-alanyl-D-alanine dipeptidase [Bartonella]|uniref:D-alanyl-D-alanine dipeptidase n=2 Tax=Bartonellaceae TaxID=772 RepID=UPI0018DC7ADE|nr:MULTISPECIES: D-alanyl-D-alanine dipeptidase [Bartonella]
MPIEIVLGVEIRQTVAKEHKMTLVKIDHADLKIDIVYATANNFIGEVAYVNATPMLHPDAADALYKAAELAKAIGLRLHIWDTYRPQAVQQRFWNFRPDERFVSNPLKGSDHTRGIAVDLTLETLNGEMLDMGTGFDASIVQSYHGATDISPEAQRNRYLLLGIMTTAGFSLLKTEWWHYALPNSINYPLIEDYDFS